MISNVEVFDPEKLMVDANNKGDVIMEKYVILDEKTISIAEMRRLNELNNGLMKYLTKEEFDELILVYKKVVDRIEMAAVRQGIEI